MVTAASAALLLWAFVMLQQRRTAPLVRLSIFRSKTLSVANAAKVYNRLVRAARTGAIDFRDINLEPEALAGFGVGVNDVRRRLHAVDAGKRLYTGIDCAIAIWLRTPGDVWLGRLLGQPMIVLSRMKLGRRVSAFAAW